MKTGLASLPKWLWGMIFLCLAAFLVRLLGIKYGLPYLSHPDEARIILDTFSMGHRFSLLPEVPDYPLLYRYLLLLVYAVYFLLGRVFQVFSGSIDFALKFLINPAPVYLISRFLSVLFGTALAVPAYFLGKRLSGRIETGVIAAIFVLWEFQLLQHSQWALYSIILCFTVLMSFYYICSLIGSPRLRNFVWAGIWCGLSISVQNQGVFVLPSLFLSYILVFFGKGGIGKKRVALYALVSLVVLGACSLIGNLYWLFIFQKSLNRMIWMVDVTRVGFSSQAPYAYNVFDMARWFAWELVRQDMLLGLIMVCGLVYALFTQRKIGAVITLFVLVHLYLVSNWGFRQLHDTITLIPVLCVLGAVFLTDIAKNKKAAFLIACLTVLPLFLQALSIDIKKMRKDTRIQAKEWIEANIPSGARIGIDWPALSVPLESDVPFLLRTPMSEKYYDLYLRPAIGRQFQESIRLKPHYRTIEIKYNSQEPIWPKAMPKDVQLEASLKPVCRDLYSHFVFKAPDTIINQDKLDYLVINSYVWSMFLFDNDPYKRNLFKPYILDRLEQNFRHSTQYIDDKRHGYLFYLAQQGRDFYLPLLNQELPEFKLVKEFIPQDNFGPEIRIYQVIRNGK
jgi:hypothetical protein